MKTAIIGGGPAGLYFAILLKKLRPESDITVYERNRADETFGFGVVFSDATLDNFEKYDLPSYQRIIREFAYWDDRNPFSRKRASDRRQRLLRLLAPRVAPHPPGPRGGTRRQAALRNRRG
jgi:2-polyprenyl-6-methoxyphenol hydroxylase-like FAD-dependent oxidoreductase